MRLKRKKKIRWWDVLIRTPNKSCSHTFVSCNGFLVANLLVYDGFVCHNRACAQSREHQKTILRKVLKRNDRQELKGKVVLDLLIMTHNLIKINYRARFSRKNVNGRIQSLCPKRGK